MQRSVSLRLGMATNEPLVPSMIFRSRTTKASLNVTEQKACRRSLLSSMSLMRTSVISTVVLLKICGPSVGPRNPPPSRGQAIPLTRLEPAVRLRRSDFPVRPRRTGMSGLLLFSTTPYPKHFELIRLLAEPVDDSLRFVPVMTQSKQAAAAAAHELPGWPRFSQQRVEL